MEKLFAIFVLIALSGCASTREAANWVEACETGTGVMSDRDAVYEVRKKPVGGEAWALVASWRTNVMGQYYCAALCAERFSGNAGCGFALEHKKAWTRFVFSDGTGTGLSPDQLEIAKKDRALIQKVRKAYDQGVK